jgi:hypothetical protein
MQIEVDGVLMLELARDSTAAVQVDPGQHEVVARMDWERSSPLEVVCTDKEPTRVEVITVAPFKALLAKVVHRKLIRVRPFDAAQ